MSKIIFNILIIEDDSDILDFITQTFDDQPSYQVTKCLESTIALEILSVEDYDLVISDQRMPEVTGLEIYDTIRSPDWSGDSNIPFIFCTGYAEDLECVKDRDNTWLVEKPFQAERLEELVNQIFEQKHLKVLKSS